MFRNKQSRNDNSVCTLSKPLLSNNNYSNNSNYPYSTKVERELDLSNREKNGNSVLKNPKTFRGSKGK
jgi:hypothetical protein